MRLRATTHPLGARHGCGVACGRRGKRGENESDGLSPSLCSHFPTSPPLPIHRESRYVRPFALPHVCVCVLLLRALRLPRRAAARAGPPASARSADTKTSAAVRRRGFRAAPAPLSTHVPAPAGRSTSVRVSMPGGEARELWGRSESATQKRGRCGGPVRARSRGPHRPCAAASPACGDQRECAAPRSGGVGGRRAGMKSAHHHPSPPYLPQSLGTRFNTPPFDPRKHQTTTMLISKKNRKDVYKYLFKGECVKWGLVAAGGRRRERVMTKKQKTHLPFPPTHPHQQRASSPPSRTTTCPNTPTCRACPTCRSSS